MKLLHLADLHLGKRMYEVCMLDDQREILNQILQIAVTHKVNAVVIAGDVYDRAVPPVQAVQLLDEFLTQLVHHGMDCLVIPGNHDSEQRLAFGASFLQKSGIYFAPNFDGTAKTVSCFDEFGEVEFVLLPFLRFAQMKRYFPAISCETDGIEVILQQHPKRQGVRRVLVAHQFVTYSGQMPESCESEVHSVGTLENVDARIFEGFDYVALGHLHRAQKIGHSQIRYAGSPLKFSFSEVNHKKSVPIVTLSEPGNVNIQLVDLKPKRDLCIKKGTFDQILHPAPGENTQDYLQIILREDCVMDAMQKVKTVYPNTLRLEFENAQTAQIELPELMQGEKWNLPELFASFYQMQTGQELTEQMKQLVQKRLEEQE